MRYISSAVGAVVLLVLIGKACDGGPGSALKGQSNATITFYGLAVDQDGAPLPGAIFEYRLEAYPKDWTFDTRGRPNDASTVTATSDDKGRFQFTVTGCTLQRLKAERQGYRHFCDEDRHGSAINNYYFRLIAWSDLWYKSDPDHPTVYVFVKDGVHEVSALPCKGGYDSANGTHWTKNASGWPKKPSLEDIVQKQSATAPASTGGAAGP
jgi:hypothetical protein